MLQVSGEAHIIWEDSNNPFEEQRSKHVEIKVLAVVEAKAANPFRMRMKELSPFSPSVPVSAASLAGAGPRDSSVESAATQKRYLVRCTEILEAASGVKSFQFEATGDDQLPHWMPGQVRVERHLEAWSPLLCMICKMALINDDGIHNQTDSAKTL